MPTFTDPDEMDKAAREYLSGLEVADAKGRVEKGDQWLIAVADAYEIDPEKLRQWVADFVDE